MVNRWCFWNDIDTGGLDGWLGIMDMQMKWMKCNAMGERGEMGVKSR